jgi:RNA polymerase sigma factor (sigma-70 family)
MEFESRLKEAQSSLWPYFRHLTNDPFLADDVLQFASVRCWQRWPDRDLADLQRLMVTIGRRFYFNYREKEKNEKLRLASLRTLRSAPPTPELVIQRRETSLQVRLALKRLPDVWSEVLYRVYFLNQTNKEAAEAMGQCLSTIKTWRLRAMRRLRSVLGKHSQT